MTALVALGLGRNQTGKDCQLGKAWMVIETCWIASSTYISIRKVYKWNKCIIIDLRLHIKQYQQDKFKEQFKRQLYICEKPFCKLQYPNQMPKKEKPEQLSQNKSHKTHKTLRQKLRKKRQQLKRHKKQKSEHKKLYNAQEQKLKFFVKGAEKEDNGKEIKLKKISKYIEKFINIYEDDLEEFYDMFKTLDEGGCIDISGLENKALYKCIKKLFKYLPVRKEKGEFKKIEAATTCLEKYIKNKVSEAVERYLENGSNQEQENDESSLEEDENKKETKKQRNKKVAKVQEEQEQKQIRLYKEGMIEEPVVSMGPFIPQQVRQQMAQMFEQSLLQRQKQKQQKDKDQEDEFAKIFSSGKTRKQMKEYPTTKSAFDVPDHLLAHGSALIGQKVDIDDGQIQEYNKIHRPKKLIDMHKELKQGIIPEDPNKRKPFDRERDIVGSGKLSLMNNSTFFDFKSRMSKPKNTNQFL